MEDKNKNSVIIIQTKERLISDSDEHLEVEYTRRMRYLKISRHLRSECEHILEFTKDYVFVEDDDVIKFTFNTSREVNDDNSNILKKSFEVSDIPISSLKNEVMFDVALVNFLNNPPKYEILNSIEFKQLTAEAEK